MSHCFGCKGLSVATDPELFQVSSPDPFCPGCGHEERITALETQLTEAQAALREAGKVLHRINEELCNVQMPTSQREFIGGLIISILALPALRRALETK